MQTAESMVHSQVEEGLYRQFGQDQFTVQLTADSILTLWVPRSLLSDVLRFLKPQFSMLYDLFAIDERTRENRAGQPAADYTVVYQLLSMERNDDIRIKVALSEPDLNLPTCISVWPNANWYEREAWDMFGVVFDGHPNLYRILLPPTWEGHALRKDHPARATEMAPFEMGPERVAKEQEALRFRPEEWGMEKASDDSEYMFLNLGPNHPSVHGVFRVALQLDGEVIVDSVPDIGYHHRGAEKMAERQTWHTYIPYTDRIDYLGGVMNNLAYIQSVEMLGGIVVPERAKIIRIMLAELFRISSHLVFYGTFVQDVGQMSPVFYMFADRERLFGIIEAITGGRMHPAWFRIGGVSQDLPEGWDTMIREFIDFLPARLDHYDKMAMQNKMLKERTVGIGVYTQQEAIDWGITGPGLRATGSDWDVRKKRPYGGYDQFEFDIPVSHNGDCYDRAELRIEEIRQSLRIIRQCVDNMPGGPYKSDHRLTTPPPKERTMEDIETLIHHFLNVSWGPVVPAGEASVMIEATKGINSYHLVSDGGTNSYRTRIRTPSFPHLQQIPLISNGLMIPDLIAIIASIDFVMADVDR
ncbi:NADH-quinone oxidoreductase subunit C/D [Porticoccaceae bacterium]|jgi:NADH-quinone oxidoreductase subunit C/D|nr:NADH-quinone oxidoreductase subunit C/D [Porticoccaceae bacterium]MBT7565021.1 NADH-quinone oxidoreductase subunit C/D [Porticoccaceae bacterium]MBT7948075.1 NADH-quinone oxidoreductase subunit C/D [Porticoccaceae bacterium]MDA7589637.1 NADH-quinone oxidoreductase subunit C/D [Porticoccaceae bacterium]MDB3884787.1 NADH-quinone oxidoreductase subunit C/D [Porticoccaceae bacterium]